MKPIWYFVGLILSSIGLVLIIAGLYNLFYAAEPKTVLPHLHADIWWGAVMFIVGLIYIIRNRKIKIE
jgi:hypothetical protein